MPNHVTRRSFVALPLALAGGAIAFRKILNAQTVFYPDPSVTVVSSTATTITLQICAGSRPSGPTGAPNGVVIRWETAAIYQANANQFVAGDFCSASYTLPIAAGACVTVVIGANQTGLTYAPGCNIGLDCGTAYEFELQALGDPSGPVGPSDLVFAQGSTQSCATCGTFTQGYWKNHPNAWPVQTLKLGTVSYTKQALLEILNQPVAGNGLISLAHQLIAAKLNVANGATCSAATTAIAAADALIGSLVVPPIGSGHLAPSATSSLVSTLDSFNSGTLAGCPAECSQ